MSIELNKGETRDIQYQQNAKVLAEVKYFKKGNVFSRGYFGIGQSPFWWDNSIERIRRLITDKIYKFQFPAHSEKKKFSTYMSEMTILDSATWIVPYLEKQILILFQIGVEKKG